jgi:cysteine desulfuration protein SufE
VNGPAARESALVADLDPIRDPHERLAAAADLARRFPKPPEAFRDDSRRVPGCVSRVWLDLEALPDGTCRIRFDADSPMVRGLVGLVAAVYDGAPPGAIAAHATEIVGRLGLDRTLSPTRLNGLAAVAAAIRARAAALAG